MPVDTGPAAGFRFFIDRASIVVGRDGIVRYTLVARSPAGAENVSYEGIRCARGEFRVYAFGRPDGAWSEARSAEWRPIDSRGAQRHHGVLRREYFCPNNIAIHTPEEGVDALRRGGHPLARGRN